MKPQRAAKIWKNEEWPQGLEMSKNECTVQQVIENGYHWHIASWASIFVFPNLCSSLWLHVDSYKFTWIQEDLQSFGSTCGMGYVDTRTCVNVTSTGLTFPCRSSGCRKIRRFAMASSTWSISDFPAIINSFLMFPACQCAMWLCNAMVKY